VNLTKITTAQAAGVPVTVLALNVSAAAVPVPPDGWTPAIGVLLTVLAVALTLAVAWHNRNRSATYGKEAPSCATALQSLSWPAC
jgi:hypothetical protein